MKLVNLTHWKSEHLRAIIARVALDELEAGARKRLVVRVVYKRRSLSGNTCGGRATLGVKGPLGYVANRMTLTLPSVTVDPVSLAKVTAHEMAHLRGLRHPEMKGARYSYRAEGWRAFYAWAAAYPIEKQPVAATPKPSRSERQQGKLAQARAMLAKWERVQKRAAARVKWWRGKVTFRTRYLAVCQAADQGLTPELASSKLTPEEKETP
jgi:hypothetical protein